MSSSSSWSKYPASVANGRFEIATRLGAGCFGEVFRAVETETQEGVAVKFEHASAGSPQLQRESALLSALARPARQQGFPEHLHFGKEGKALCMVMELLGKSLEDHLQKSGGRFSDKTTALVAQQALQRMEYLHSRGIVHRDIKPENFVFGVGAKQHHLYLIDFGLSHKYWERRHIRMQTRLTLTGTARYASISVHRGHEQSRRDDLEAVGHMLVYLLRGSLPWSGLDAKDREEKFRRIKEVKESTQLEDLCRACPAAFQKYLEYCRNLAFRARPDYAMLGRLFSDLRNQISRDEDREVQDHDFQWNGGKDLGPLEPLAPPSCLAQPDDVEPSQQPRWHRCFCAPSRG